MSRVRFSAVQVLQHKCTSDEQYSDAEEEDVSEEEDEEEYNPEHDAPSSEEDDQERNDTEAIAPRDEEASEAASASARDEEASASASASARNEELHEEVHGELHDEEVHKELHEEEDEDEEDDEERHTFPSKNGKITWSWTAYTKQGRMTMATAAARREDEDEEEDEETTTTTTTAAVNTTPPGPTSCAVSHVRDIASAFYLFITPPIEKIILEMTNLEGMRKHGWKRMDEIDLRACVGLLILAGVYKSRGEAAASLWDSESGRSIFRATMPLKVFHAYSVI